MSVPVSYTHLEQGRNEIRLDESLLTHIPTKSQHFPDEAKRDLIIALITLKSVSYTHLDVYKRQSSSTEASIKTAATYSPAVTQYHRRDKA